VKVTDCPLADGFTEEMIVVAVVAGPTVCIQAADALAVSPVSPL
jgi:hypothetical protein